MEDYAWDQIFGEKRYLSWMKSNELWSVFYRTTVAGHWSKEDVQEFNQCQYAYEIHMDHGNDDAAHSLCLKVMERCSDFKAAKYSKLAVNDMKVIVILAKSKRMTEKIKHVAKQHGFELARIRDKDSQASQHEVMANTVMGDYMESLRRAFAPMTGYRATKV